MSTLENAVAAIDAAIEVFKAAKAKAEDIIAAKLFEGGDTDEEIALVAHLDVEIQTLENRKPNFAAAGVVVSAPSVGEIVTVKELITQIKELAVHDAVRAASVEVLKGAVAQAKELSAKVT